jgi:hypothetical protein
MVWTCRSLRARRTSSAPGPAGISSCSSPAKAETSYRPVLASYAEFAALPELLAARGLGGTDIDKILGGNALDLLRIVTAQL